MKRTESDALGSMQLPADALYGIHTARAMNNFPLSGYRLHTLFIRAYAEVKLACARVNARLGHLDPAVAGALEAACHEMIAGLHHGQIVVDAFQGGAGTSTNMNVNEVLANRAAQLLGHAPGSGAVHPLDHANLHQSTNDTYPTALKVAVLHALKELEQPLTQLQETLQHKEQTFDHVVRLARTQLQDAVPITAGMTFGAWAEAIARDRWRIFKCRERIRQVNLGGTAVGTGLGAPRDFIFKAAEELRSITGLGISRAENLVDATQNLDPFVEVSGMLKACAVNLLKICTDARLLASGPAAGIGEMVLPAVQAGSTIMPGKVNPVIPEAVSQAALRVMSNDALIGQAAAMGNLELNQFLPLVAHALLESLHLLHNAVITLHERCLRDARPDTERCAAHLATGGALAAVLVPALGYERVEHFIQKAISTHTPLAGIVAAGLNVPREAISELLAAKKMRQMGYTAETYAAVKGKTDADA